MALDLIGMIIIMVALEKKGLFWDRLHHIQFLHISLIPQITEFSYLKKKKKKNIFFLFWRLCFADYHFLLQLLTITYVLLTIMFWCLNGVEMVLRDVGYPVKLGSGVAAAAAYLQNTIPMIPSRI